MKAMPAITSFSDCIVLSIALEEIKSPFDIGNAVNALLSLIQQLADSLITGGYILRGGMTRGPLYHDEGIVFGLPLVEAYQLESVKAKNPRILLSDERAKAYNSSKYDTCNFLSKDAVNEEGDEYYLDYLKLSFQIEQNREKYRSKAKDMIAEIKEGIFDKIKDGNLIQLNENIKCLEKWVYFEKKLKKQLA